MRALITGCDGFLGANLARYLLDHGHSVVGACLNRKGETSLDALNVSLRLEYGDVTDPAYMARLLNAYEIETVFHLAAVSIVRVAERDKGRAIRANVMGTVVVCEAAERHGAKIIVASSDKAYGDQGGETYREEMALRPTGAYEVSKACQDMVARLYGAVVVRAANLYGPGDLHWSRLVPNSCRLALAGQAPAVYGDAATHEREWLHVEDACRAYALLAEKGEPGHAYNVSSGEGATALDIACLIARMAGAPVPALIEKAAKYYEIPCQSLNCRKIYRLGWASECKLRDGLFHTLEWYKRQLCGTAGVLA